MSIASVFLQQITSDKPAKLKKELIEELSNWKDPNATLCNMGVLLAGSAKDEYLKELEKRARDEVSSKVCTVETLFWMYYLAVILEFQLPVKSNKESVAKNFVKRYLKDQSKDIEEYVSAIKLI